MTSEPEYEPLVRHNAVPELEDLLPDDIVIAAMADAAFSGRTFLGLSTVEKARYLERAQFVLTAVMDQYLTDANTVKRQLTEHLNQLKGKTGI